MTTADSVLLIVLCVISAVATRAAGPVLLGQRELPRWTAGVTPLIAPALFGALVATQALANGSHLAVGPETAGVLAGGVLAWRGVSLIVCVVAGAAVTALLRATN